MCFAFLFYGVQFIEGQHREVNCHFEYIVGYSNKAVAIRYVLSAENSIIEIIKHVYIIRALLKIN